VRGTGLGGALVSSRPDGAGRGHAATPAREDVGRRRGPRYSEWERGEGTQAQVCKDRGGRELGGGAFTSSFFLLLS
jgi:hypothetical protein